MSDLNDGIKRDRLSGYVEPETTEVINQVKEELKEKVGFRVSIGQAVDYIAREYKKGKG